MTRKYERLSVEERKKEIQSAAIKLFNEKGFAKTTMENIVENVTLSKGGVYRIYPSTTEILKDIIIYGMHLRNRFYEEYAKKEIASGGKLTLPFIVKIIGDSLKLYPEISSVYVEFLWEKRRNPKLEELYHDICSQTIDETIALIKKYDVDNVINISPATLAQLTELMNTTIMGIHVLDIRHIIEDKKNFICNSIAEILKNDEKE